MRWIPLQKAESRKWRLCVLYDDCMTYDVTTLESEHVEKIILYTAYMNDGVNNGIETEILQMLDHLRNRYGLS